MASVVRFVRSVIAPITRTRLFRRTAPVWMPPLEFVVRRLSGGRMQLSGLLVPSLVLHSTGAKSGLARDTDSCTPLTAGAAPSSPAPVSPGSGIRPGATICWRIRMRRSPSAGAA